MQPVTERTIFDLHCDTLTECLKHHTTLEDPALHFSLSRIPPGARWCQCMAVFVPDRLRGEAAWEYFEAVYEVWLRETARPGGPVAVADAGTVPAVLARHPVAAILTVEGGAALAGRLDRLAELHARGVRMMTLTWNAENEIAGGAATDRGFTPFGRRAVEEMERLGIAVDVSHLSDRAFWELCGFARRPFLASHSNARAVCGHRRNLTDGMFREIAARGGVVGINYYDDFLVEGGGSRSVDDLLRHVHHFLALDGADTLALGSDFDGADMPPYLGGADRLPFLADALERSGIAGETVEKILFGNAHRYLSELASAGTPTEENG